MKEFILSHGPFVVAFLALVIPLVVYIVQQQLRYAQLFHDCAKSLFSDNPIEQSTSAILLRGFLKRPFWKIWNFRPNYTKETKNLMVAMLRNSITVNLQKTIADGFSYANNLNGQDMQYVNMVNALIKPKSRIRYELTGNVVFKHSRISMRKADFFHAVLQECSVNNVNAKGAVFYCAILCGTSFRNCILKNANFSNSNVRKVRFDEDCKLDGAIFKGAVGLDTATIRISGDANSHPLLEYLDDKGVFHSKGVPSNSRYVYSDENLNVFVSKLGSMDPQQRMQYDSAISALKKLGKVEIQKIEREQYPTVSQLTDVSTHLDNCDGCVIFAFEYLNVESGFIHKNVKGNDRKVIEKKTYPSPWLHIEAALANGKQMPCLIIYEENLCRDGMFDDTIIRSDKNMYSIPYSDSISSKDKNMLQNWLGLVREYHYNKNIREN